MKKLIKYITKEKEKFFGLCFLIIFLIFQFIISIYSKIVPIEIIDVIIALIPLTFVLLFSGKLAEITWPGGISIKLREEGQKSIVDLVKVFSEEYLEPDPEVEISKGVIAEIPDDTHRVILTFEIGKKGFYEFNAINRYIRFLENKVVIERVLFKSPTNKFEGVIDIEDFKTYIRENNSIVEKIETGEILDIPDMITFSIMEETSIKETLIAMERHNTSIMPVVDSYLNYIGVIDQGSLFRKMFIKITRDN